MFTITLFYYRVASSTDNVKVGRFSDDFVFSTAEKTEDGITEKANKDVNEEATEEGNSDTIVQPEDVAESDKVTDAIPSVPASDMAVKPSSEEVDVREAKDDTAKKDASDPDAVEESNADAAQQQSLKTGGGTSSILNSSLFILTLIFVSIER